jgi:outer membrane lipoprotein-sorting protein
MLLIVMAVVSLPAQVRSPFSADFKFTSPKGMSGTGKLYFDGNYTRMEMSSPQNPMGQMIVITDMARKVADTLMPTQKMYMEASTDSPQRRGPGFKMYDPANPCANVPDTTCKKGATEMVNGSLCDKWEFAGKVRMTVWIDQKNLIPVRSVMEDGTTTEITNVKPGPQDPSLFQIPAEYHKMDLGGMMKGMKPPE